MTGPVGIEPFVGPQPAASSSGGTFISQWNTANTSTGSSTSDQISLPLVSSGSYDFTVYWGDGSSDTITAWDDAAKTHTYASAGTYTVQIVGAIRGWQFNNSGDRLKLLDIQSWGPLRVGNITGHFYGCRNLNFTAVDAPGLSVTLENTFRNCESLSTPNLSAWNVGGVTNMQQTFDGATVFNADLTGWDTSNVTNFYRTFSSCPAFNQPIGSWDVSRATSFNSMFVGATAFNQHLSDWDVSSLTNASYMFLGATAFNGDVSTWNTQSLTSATSMFHGATAFNGRLDYAASQNPVRIEAAGGGTSYASTNTWVSGNAVSGDFVIDLYLETLGTSTVFGIQADTAAGSGNADIDFGLAWVDEATVRPWSSGALSTTSAALAVGDRVRFQRSGSTISVHINNSLVHTYATTTSSSMYFIVKHAATAAVTSTVVVENFYGQQITDGHVGANVTATYLSPTSPRWNVSGVTSMATMFSGAAAFNQPLGSWDVSSVTNFSGMFQNATAFNRSVAEWNTASATNMANMFSGASAFNQPISLPYPTNFVTNLSGSSYGDTNTCILSKKLVGDFRVDYVFKTPPGSPLVFGVQTAMAPNGTVTNYTQLNYGIQWTGSSSINAWELGTNSSHPVAIALNDVVSFRRSGNTVSLYVNDVHRHTFSTASTAVMYASATFGVTTAITLQLRYNDFGETNAFHHSGSTLTKTLVYDGTEASDYGAGWDTSAVTTLSGMFQNAAAFNGSIGRINVSAAADLSSMFSGAAAFNRSLDAWTTSSATTMANMFNGATAFAYGVDQFDFADVTNLTGFMSGKTYSSFEYEALLTALLTALDAAPSLQSGVTLDMGSSKYPSSASTARSNIVSEWGWTINDGGVL